MSSKTLGILMYIDDTPQMLEEFEWIYKSWIYSGNWTTSDLIAVCNPTVLDNLPNDTGVIKIPVEPISQPHTRWWGYPFINSIGCLVGPHLDELVGNYTHFLRTDADVFITHNLVNFRPNVPVFGRGHYADEPSVRQKLIEFAAKLGFEHAGVFNCGHSLLGSTTYVRDFLSEQLAICELLLEELRDEPGQWPYWCVNVITMYAAELTANRHWRYNLRLGFHNILDYETVLMSDITTSNVYHIHALLINGEHWSKLDYRAGQYSDYDISKLDRNKVNEYCHWIAATTIPEIKQLAGYIE